MKSVKFLAESVASSGAVYKVGETYTLEDHAAFHWMKRGTAESVESVKAEPKAKKQKDDSKQEEK